MGGNPALAPYSSAPHLDDIREWAQHEAMPRAARLPRQPVFPQRALFAVLVLFAAILGVLFLAEASRFFGTPAPSAPDLSDGADSPGVVGFVVVGGLVLSALSVLPLLLIVLRSVGRRGLRPLFKPAAAIAISVLGLILLDALDSPRRASRAMGPLVEAIQRFEHDHGAPPSSLEVLVPEYIAAIPTTGCPSYPTVLYATSELRGTARSWSLSFEGWNPTRLLRYEPERGHEAHDVIFQTHRYGDWVLTVWGLEPF
jgi:hypothetical protein